jgi:hypothetical protein
MDAGDDSRAIAVLQQVVDEFPESYHPRIQLAEAYYRSGERRLARREIESEILPPPKRRFGPRSPLREQRHEHSTVWQPFVSSRDDSKKRRTSRSMH